MRIVLYSVAVLAALAGPSIAQPAGAERQGTVRSALPSPDLPPGSKPSDYLRAAQAALATGHPRETEEALEEAQTRILDRSVPLFQTNNPSDNPATLAITQAREALAAHDRAGCMQSIQAALAAAARQGL